MQQWNTESRNRNILRWAGPDSWTRDIGFLLQLLWQMAGTQMRKEKERCREGSKQLFRLKRMCIGQSESPSLQSLQIINAGEGVEKREPPLHHLWECKLMLSLWKIVWGFLGKLKIEFPYNPPILLLGMYMEKTKTLVWKDTCPSGHSQDMEAT